MKRIFTVGQLDGSYAVYDIVFNRIILDLDKIRDNGGGIIDLCGICIHELVHYLQWNILGNLDWDNNWRTQMYRREWAAYFIQSLFYVFFLRRLKRSIRSNCLRSMVLCRRTISRSL